MSITSADARNAYKQRKNEHFILLCVFLKCAIISAFQVDRDLTIEERLLATMWNENGIVCI